MRNKILLYFDQNFALLRSMLGGLREHLNAEGKALLAYGSVDGIRQVQRLSDENGLRVQVLDDRDPETLAPVFLPGLLLEVTPGQAVD